MKTRPRRGLIPFSGRAAKEGERNWLDWREREGGRKEEGRGSQMIIKNDREERGGEGKKASARGFSAR